MMAGLYSSHRPFGFSRRSSLGVGKWSTQVVAAAAVDDENVDCCDGGMKKREAEMEGVKSTFGQNYNRRLRG